MITAEQLRELLAYDPDTGVFVWRVSSSNRAAAGKVAGKLNCYWQIGVLGRRYLAHRLAWLYVHGRWPTHEIDHINRVKTDNRIANLREATRSQNQANGARHNNNKTGFRGVGLLKWGRYAATIKINKRQTHLGCFDTAEQASAAYQKAVKELFGEFANEQK